VLTNFEYIITPSSGHAWTHGQSPSAFNQCQRHKNSTRNARLERLSNGSERENSVSFRLKTVPAMLFLFSIYF